MRITLSLLISVFSLSQLAGAYDLKKTYQGSTFFDDWTYIDDWDHWTNGDVQYQSRAQAGNLTTVNAAGNAVIRVDDFSGLAYLDKRRSIRLENPYIFNNTNAVLVYDVVHVPYGCSVWGSLWTKSGISQWPKGGEVDIFEAVNKMTNNQMALHTEATCTIATTSSDQTGSLLAPDCSLHANADGTFGNPSGCEVTDPSANSYSNFAAAGGGVWVAQYASSGVYIWFFTRSTVPSGLTDAQTIDVTTLGKPTASFPSSSTCDMSQALEPQQMVIDITLCGDWAGANATIEATCGALTAERCYLEYVPTPDNYHEAYFEIASIKIFGDDATSATNTTENGTSSGTETGAGTGTRTGISSTTSTNTASTSSSSWAAKVTLWSSCSLLLLGLAMVVTL